MKIMFFGITKELAGGPSLDVPLQPATVGELRGWLMERYPAMKNLRAVMIAVNKTYAGDAQPLAEGDEVAVIPPLSGG
ncbi:molybdopterin converting factor subunit 1 [Chitinophaga sp. GCM10012297]|uniref:Molybdopterin synthase sulfur carrier subunit n=1 Tax=Chitinophaga chungangae TaxID=2821488 RepID=A0ABS3Y970_9BACT|nr:molybdopterin converting factor subunit 1 [Chitinophaga chungangae]MBO9151230.1 molybdopterin converting factor subunit 1 [Chitinophaga chungangae]